MLRHVLVLRHEREEPRSYVRAQLVQRRAVGELSAAQLCGDVPARETKRVCRTPWFEMSFPIFPRSVKTHRSTYNRKKTLGPLERTRRNPSGSPRQQLDERRAAQP